MNVAEIHMEILFRHFMSQFDGSLARIDTQLHDCSIPIIQVLFVFHAPAWHFRFWTSSNPETQQSNWGRSWRLQKCQTMGEENNSRFNHNPVKNVTRFSHMLLTGVWSKMTPNPMEISSLSYQMPWKFHDLALSKIHVMFEQHVKQVQPT